MTSFLFQINCKHSQIHLGIQGNNNTSITSSKKQTMKLPCNHRRQHLNTQDLTELLAEHILRTAEGTTDEQERLRLIYLLPPLLFESLIFQNPCPIRPLLPSLTHPTILGWNSCKVAAKQVYKPAGQRWATGVSFKHQHHDGRNNLAAETSYQYYPP